MKIKIDNFLNELKSKYMFSLNDHLLIYNLIMDVNNFLSSLIASGEIKKYSKDIDRNVIIYEITSYFENFRLIINFNDEEINAKCIKI